MNISDFPTTFSFPTIIRFGPGVIRELPLECRQKNWYPLLIVSDTSVKALPFFKTFLNSLTEQEIEHHLFHEIHPNPLESDVIRGVDIYRKHNCRAVVGFGGGAAMDTARAIALAANHREKLFSYCEDEGGFESITEKIPPIITVPTTAGTGSEVGRSAVISDDQSKKKKILFHPSLIASKVYCDPELTESLPSHIAAATGMDALTHHLEAYLSKGFHPLCDGIALQGIQIAVKYLEKAVVDKDLESRTMMMACAMMGAVAFQKGLGLIHSMAHALSAFNGMHHGLANAVLLQHGMEFNLTHCREKFTVLSKLIGETPRSEAFLSRIIALRDKIGIGSKLSSYGISQKDCDPLSSLAYEDVCHQSNPRPVSKEDFRSLFLRAL